ncbi:hypothetical protein ABZW30_34410 [Kitasatospora sp. NPDC004669]|uniref:hypothetical protein n=1 Tax=Kitasatospora sp. NPDC004669 TaxID=3154555 RepID=UPI0033B9271E
MRPTSTRPHSPPRAAPERKAFSEVADAIAKPNLSGGGTVIASYSRLIEFAHRVRRALHELNTSTLTKVVLAEAATELAAVEKAEHVI